MASAIDSTLLSLRSTVAPGNDIAEIQVASAECLSKFRWKPKLRRACEDEAASPVVSLFWAPFSLIGDGGGGTPKG